MVRSLIQEAVGRWRLWPESLPTRAEQPSLPDPSETPDVPYELAQQTLQRQLDAADALDAKITNSFSTAVALVTLLGAVFALRPERFAGGNTTWFYLSLVPLGLITALSALGTISRRWRTGPKAEDVIQKYRAGDDELTVKWKVTRAVIASIGANRRALNIKNRIHQACYALIVLQVVVVIKTLVGVAS